MKKTITLPHSNHESKIYINNIKTQHHHFTQYYTNYICSIFVLDNWMNTPYTFRKRLAGKQDVINSFCCFLT